MSALKSFFRIRSLHIVALGGLVCLSGGCDSSAKLTPVTGHVTGPDGKPLTSGTVNFHPNKAKDNSFGQESLGDIDAQGEFTLQTRGKPGAPLGWYKVTVASMGPTTPDNTNPSTTSLVNTTYSNAATTPLEEVVDKAAPGAYDLKVGP